MCVYCILNFYPFDISHFNYGSKMTFTVFLYFISYLCRVPSYIFYQSLNRILGNISASRIIILVEQHVLIRKLIVCLPPVVTAVNTTITTERGWDKNVELRCDVDGKISKYNFSLELNILQFFTRKLRR
jgi:hypothetical protein